MPIDLAWKSPIGIENATELRTRHADAFQALGELDAAGHRLLRRAAEPAGSGIQHLVGLAFLRRNVTMFTGTRTLFESANVEPAKLTVRAQFELLLAARYLVHAGRRDLHPEIPMKRRGRESRARYYLAATLRRQIYKRQAVLNGEWGRLRIGKDRSGIQSEIQNKLQQLNRYLPAQQRAFGPLRCFPTRGKKPRYYDDKQWFSFGFRSGRVNSIRGLAHQLGYRKEYEMIYDALSGLTHSRGIEHDLHVLSGKAVDILHPHMVEAFDQLCFWATSFASRTLLLLAKAYHPDSIPDLQRTDILTRRLLARLKPGLPLGFSD